MAEQTRLLHCKYRLFSSTSGHPLLHLGFEVHADSHSLGLCLKVMIDPASDVHGWLSNVIKLLTWAKFSLKVDKHTKIFLSYLFTADCFQRVVCKDHPGGYRCILPPSPPPSNLQKKKKENAMRASTRDGNRALRSARKIASAL